MTRIVCVLVNLECMIKKKEADSRDGVRDYKSMCKSLFAKDKQKTFCAVTSLLMHVVIKDLLKHVGFE